MPDISFNFNAASLLQPVLVLVFAYLVNVAKKAVERNVDARHVETTAHLNRIEAQTTKTNGRVDTLESSQKEFEREHSVFRERLSHVEGQAEVLLREKGHPV